MRKGSCLPAFVTVWSWLMFLQGKTSIFFLQFLSYFQWMVTSLEMGLV